ncbi:hypothetical protein SSCG_05010 [Streptomyces clavuligerus]|nr:hypothetical protein SSCG_05010 [Streptomyces clavuligerus]
MAPLLKDGPGGVRIWTAAPRASGPVDPSAPVRAVRGRSGDRRRQPVGTFTVAHAFVTA